MHARGQNPLSGKLLEGGEEYSKEEGLNHEERTAAAAAVDLALADASAPLINPVIAEAVLDIQVAARRKETMRSQLAAEAAATATEAAAKAKTSTIDGLLHENQKSYSPLHSPPPGRPKPQPPPVMVMPPGGTILPAFRHAEDTPKAVFSRLPPLM